MENIKKSLVLIFITMMMLSTVVTASENVEIPFNEFGFKSEELQDNIQKEINGAQIAPIAQMRTLSTWENFEPQTNVSLDKKWTVKFSRKFESSSIAAVSIVRGNEFIPVKIDKTSEDKLIVFPQEKFSGNTNYSLRIVLENGNKYKKDFTTIKEYRHADNEPNNDFKEASVIHTNETISGQITKGDVDVYKVEVPKEGILAIDLLSIEQLGLDVRLYGEDYELGSMMSVSNKTKSNITEGVMPGVYYIHVKGYSTSTESNYELGVTFNPSHYKDDTAGATFVEAQQIAVNEKYTGHIGYKIGRDLGNYTDYYKVEVPKEGILSIDLLSLEQKYLDITLYGENYDLGSINSVSNKIKSNITEGLLAGTYYIRVKGYYNSTYSPYELSVTHNPTVYQDDNAGSTFVNAQPIALDKSYIGHIGYKSAPGVANYTDYYKVEVPKEGVLDIDLLSLEQKYLDITLYGANYDLGYISDVSNKWKSNISDGVLPGTYYIRVKGYYSSTYSPYELSVTYNPSQYENDTAGSTFVEAGQIDLNKKHTGHIGYKSAPSVKNDVDYYKVEVPREGTLNIDLLSLEQKYLDIALYGENYDLPYIKSVNNKWKSNITEDLLPGTYYIRVKAYYNSTYSPYDLNITFY